MTAVAGFKAFDPAKEDWTSYSERLTHYFIAMGISDASKQCSTLLSVCRPETYRLLWFSYRNQREVLRGASGHPQAALRSETLCDYSAVQVQHEK